MINRWWICLVVALISCKREPAQAPRPVFKDKAGNQLTTNELEKATGTFNWSLVGSENVPEKAQALLEQGRRAGGSGDNARALALFAKAQALAPTWPYPLYEAAYTHLMMGEIKEALPLYEKVKALAPRGFFSATSELDCLQRETRGTLFAGFCAAFITLEFEQDVDKRRAVLTALSLKVRDFPQLWLRLSKLLPEKERSQAIETGLALDCDAETRGWLQIDKALLLNERGEREAAAQLLGEIISRPETELGVVEMARFALGHLGT